MEISTPLQYPALRAQFSLLFVKRLGEDQIILQNSCVGASMSLKLVHTTALSELDEGAHVYIWSSPFHSHHGIIIHKGEDEYTTRVLEFNTPKDNSNDSKILQKSKAKHQVVIIITLKTFSHTLFFPQVSLHEFTKDGRESLKTVQYGDKLHWIKRSGMFAHKLKVKISRMFLWWQVPLVNLHVIQRKKY